MALTRLHVVLGALAAAVTMAVAVALVLQAREDDGAAPPRPPRASLSVVSTSVRPPAHHFGELVVAELVVLANKQVIDPESVRFNPDFSPYEPVGPRQVDRRENATSVRWRFRFRLRCLKEGCAPEGPRRTMEFPGAGVVYRFRSSPGRSTAIVNWAPFEVTARVPDASLAPERWRADVISLPAVTYGRSAGTVAVLLLGGSFLLALVGGGLVWGLARPRRDDQIVEAEQEVERLTALERALRLAREAALDGDSPERRKAFERVARELSDRGHAELAQRARALAWASGPASTVAIDELERDAHGATNGSVA